MGGGEGQRDKFVPTLDALRQRGTTHSEHVVTSASPPPAVAVESLGVFAERVANQPGSWWVK